MKQKKAVLIIGGSGFVGTHLSLKLREHYKVYATFYKNFIKVPGVTPIPMDALSRDWVKKVVYSIEPDIIIYCAGKSDIEWTERNQKEAERDHAIAPINVLTAAEIIQPKFIFLSNSYVFEGSKGNYHEDDNVLPDTQMGKCKLRTENFIRGKSLNYVIIRSSPVIGRGNGFNYSLLDKIRMKLAAGETVELSQQETHSFASVYGLSEVIQNVIDSGIKNKILHYGGLTKVSNYEFGMKLCQSFGLDEKKIVPMSTGESKASNALFDFSLNSSETVKLFKIKPLLLEQSFDLLKEHFLIRL